MQSFEKLPEVQGSLTCGTCGCGARQHLHMDRVIAVGFGNAGFSRDGVVVWAEGQLEEPLPTVADVEALASVDPDHDWRIFFFAPLYEAEYQRQGKGEWVLISKGEGFA